MVVNQITYCDSISKTINTQLLVFIMTVSKNSREEDERILSALKENPELKNCILEMLDIAQDPIRDQKLKLGDDAEDAVVDVIQKTGKKLLEEWAQRRSEQAAKEVSQKPKHQPHGKKK